MRVRSELTIDFLPIEQEVLRADEFLKLVRENPGLIKSSKVVSPKPGKPGFGRFLVNYSRPVYRHL